MTFRLLHVEDNSGDADLAAEWLADVKDVSFEIDHVTTLTDAIATLESRDYDGVILDLNLPDSIGIDTLKRLVSVAVGLPIIVFSGTDDPNLRSVAQTEGALHVIAKNGASARLLTRGILEIVRRANAERTNHQFENLISVMPDAVIVTTLDGVVQFVNPAAQVLFGRDREELMGERISFSVKEGHVSEIEITEPKSAPLRRDTGRALYVEQVPRLSRDDARHHRAKTARQATEFDGQRIEPPGQEHACDRSGHRRAEPNRLQAPV
ncbi:MAG: response regulator [Xanthobacteraceae bacterium]